MTLTVMAGLVPAIYAVTRPLASNVLCSGAAWMAGTSPAMTAVAASYRTPDTCGRNAIVTIFGLLRSARNDGFFCLGFSA
jgi:hypothetical protein